MNTEIKCRGKSGAKHSAKHSTVIRGLERCINGKVNTMNIRVLNKVTLRSLEGLVKLIS